jgi:hypothetical protein
MQLLFGKENCRNTVKVLQGKKNVILKSMLSKVSVATSNINLVHSRFYQTKLLAIGPFYKPISVIKINAAKNKK